MEEPDFPKKGGKAFERFYSAVWGERWPRLREALLQESAPQGMGEGVLLQPYYLDTASRLAAELLPVSPGDKVLDLCAAPGGKTLVLAQKLRGQGSLVSNELSSARRERLKRVLRDHLPEIWQGSVSVTGKDATRWGLYQKEIYDAVLLDAPCSSERHVLHSPKHLELWSPHRTKALAQQAVALLCSALETVKTGGFVLYATCSVSPEENQGALEKFQKKRPGRWAEVPLSQAIGERQSWGYLILPDTHQGQGPLFFCLWQKLAP